MELQTIRYEVGRGWTHPFPDLDSDRTLVLVFGASSYLESPEPLVELKQHFPQAVIAGCSTSGEVFGDGIYDGSLAVAIARFDASTLRFASVEIGNNDSQMLGDVLGRELMAPDIRGALVLSDGLGINGTALALGLTGGLPDGVVVTGGLAGDGDRFERTWVIGEDGLPVSGIITAIGFYGDKIEIRHGSGGGWDTFGPERKVTKSEHNVLYELDGQPALDLYKEYLGTRAAGLPATALLFPLAIRQDNDGKQLVRTILAVNEERKTMTFAGDIPQGCNAQLMKANFERLIDGAAEAATLAGNQDENPLTTLAIAVSCVGRRLVLAERAEEEIEVTCDALPAESKLVGFYSYGELSPSSNGSCDGCEFDFGQVVGSWPRSCSYNLSDYLRSLCLRQRTALPGRHQ